MAVPHGDRLGDRLGDPHGDRLGDRLGVLAEQAAQCRSVTWRPTLLDLVRELMAAKVRTRHANRTARPRRKKSSGIM